MSKEAPSTPTSAVTTTPSLKSSNRKSRLPTSGLSDSDSSENEGTPFPTPSHHIPHPHHTHHYSHPETTDRLETSDRMSKEKQKFFRSSAFNADKKRDKKKPSSESTGDKIVSEKEQSRDKSLGKKSEQTRVSHGRTCKTKVKDEAEDKSNARPNRQQKEIVKKGLKADAIIKEQEKDVASKKELKKPVVSSSSSSECSSSSDDSDSSDSDSDSSTQPSESSQASRQCGNVTIPRLFATTNKKIDTFGSVSGLNLSKDGMWGFAAAAAEARKKESNTEPLSFAAVAESKPAFNNDSEKSSKSYSTYSDDKTSSSSSSVDRMRPGFGQLKGLFDGLSHLFTAPSESRSRTGNTPNYNPNRRKRTTENDKIPVESNKSEGGAKIDHDVTVKKPKCNEPPHQKIPTPATSFLPSEDDCTQMTPSDLVKKAVNSKRHELERRKFFKTEAGLGTVGLSQNSMLEDARMKKRNLIAEATQANHPLSVLPITNNQTGKIGLRTHTPYIFPFPSRILSAYVY